MLSVIPNSCKNKKICDKTVDYYSYALEFIINCHKV